MTKRDEVKSKTIEAYVAFSDRWVLNDEKIKESFNNIHSNIQILLQ